MKPTSARPEPAPHILSTSLFLAGLLCIGLAVWLGTFDFAATVARRIVQARGAMSPETAAWLRGLDLGKFFL